MPAAVGTGGHSSACPAGSSRSLSPPLPAPGAHRTATAPPQSRGASRKEEPAAARPCCSARLCPTARTHRGGRAGRAGRDEAAATGTPLRSPGGGRAVGSGAGETLERVRPSRDSSWHGGSRRVPGRDSRGRTRGAPQRRRAPQQPPSAEPYLRAASPAAEGSASASGGEGSPRPAGTALRILQTPVLVSSAVLLRVLLASQRLDLFPGGKCSIPLTMLGPFPNVCLAPLCVLQQ